MAALHPAPDWRIAHWLNVRAPLTLESLRGRVVFAIAFQMLCPGCVSQGLPQAQRVRTVFPETDLAVIGLHTVFEHHEAQGTALALAAFLHEYRIYFPVGIDAQSGAGVPETMRAYQMQGTPTTILLDREGRLRLQKFGHLDDLRLGASIQVLIGKRDVEAPALGVAAGEACDEAGCLVSQGARA